MSELHLYNSLKKQKEIFKSIVPGQVGMYVCGPTVYSYVHLGNCRTFLSFDILYRYLSFLGYKVRYVRNITDVGHLENDADEGEDKIAKKARLEQLEPMEIVQRYTLDFRKVMQQFNALPPSIEPTATGHIMEQIEMIQDIINNGYAYESEGSVYFDVKKYSKDQDYGELSGRNIDELLEGTRDLDGQSEKRNSVDFALWKKASPEHIMRWNSPWSIGFPGWHLECSVMSQKYLGETFDIHGGGMDLKFPHHECEIAQNKASSGKNPVNYWLHGNMLTLNGQRMSKSTGNTLLPEELFTGNNDKLEKAYDPVVVRFFMLQAHYRSTLDFSSNALNAAEKGFHKLQGAIEALESLKVEKETTIETNKFKDLFKAAMDDDLNTPILIAHMFDAAKVINTIKDGKATINQQDLIELKEIFSGYFYGVLGLKSLKEAGGNNSALDPVMDLVLELRMNARTNKDWTTSDLIRDKLNEAGITVKDSKDGSSWELN